MTCGCQDAQQQHRQRFAVHFAGGSRIETLHGRTCEVFPVVMLREGVVNGGLVLRSELHPQSWNGVPVTVGHPESSDGAPLSANAPHVWDQWRVGTIFNARLEGDKLKGEAWIDVALADTNHRGLLDTLRSGVQMDVSTGYFSTDELSFGVFADDPYIIVYRDMKPDHLALLPGDVGACSWEDGCGVRANKETAMTDKPTTEQGDGRVVSLLRRAIEPLLATQRRGPDDDPRQMVADLLANDDTPFTPVDELGLREMSYEALKDMLDKYIPKANKQGEGRMTTKTDAQPAPKDGAGTPALTEAQILELVTNSVKEAVASAVPAAVEHAINSGAKASLIATLATNSGVPSETLEKLSLDELRTMSEKLAPKANFAGRGFSTTPAESGTAEFKATGMANPHALNGAAPKEGAQ